MDLKEIKELAEKIKTLTNEEFVDLLYYSKVSKNEDRDTIFLNDLDFSKYDCDITTSNMVVNGSLFQAAQDISGNLIQSDCYVSGYLDQSKQNVYGYFKVSDELRERIYQKMLLEQQIDEEDIEKREELIKEIESSVQMHVNDLEKISIEQSYNKANGQIRQGEHHTAGGIYQAYHSTLDNIIQGYHFCEGDILEGCHTAYGGIFEGSNMKLKRKLSQMSDEELEQIKDRSELEEPYKKEDE